MSLENGYLLKERYRILDILGQGGMGAVYRAIDENLDITVAVKENAFLSDDYARQFQREAKILASLRHPNLPRVFDYFVLDQQGQYLVMDYIEGDDLRQWMSREEEISEVETLQIGIAICNALTYLHSRIPAITHRDIKPGNIKMTPTGEIILVDFGLVKIMGEKELTTTAARAMTPGYSPPEQYGDTPTDHRSDIFSLGATLYAALAGYLPEDSLSRATGKSELIPLRSYNPLVSQKTAGAIEKAISLQFEDRWQSASEFKMALLAAYADCPVEDKNTSRIPESAFNNSGETAPTIFDLPTKSPLKKFAFSIKEKGFDPVWIIYGLVIIAFSLLFIFSLFWPERLQNVIPGWIGSIASQTTAEPEIGRLTPTRQPPTEANSASSESTVEPTFAQTMPIPVTPTPTPIGGGGELAFVSERSGIPQIWLVHLSSGELTSLTDLSDGACQPDWSPEGDRIVFTSPCPGDRIRYPKSSLYILYLENGVIQPLPTSLEGDFDPAWSPDGNWIVYTTLINDQRQLAKINLDDYTVERLSDGNYQDFQPAWSPDGTKLVFIRNRSYDQVWIMDADGSQPEQFSYSGSISNSHPVWYGDKGLILFSQELGYGSPSKQLFGMRIVDIGKPQEYPIIPENFNNYTPLLDHADISPDGFWVTFDLWYFDVLSDIYIMTFPGANLQQVTDHPGEDYDPAWRP